MPVSTARFANVAFSDGSLLHGFRRRLEKRQPLSAPSDVRRYFVTGEEAGILCLLSIGLGGHQEIFFPKLDEEKDTATFAGIACKFLRLHGYEPLECQSEAEARAAMRVAPAQGKWPCHIFASDTTGEKYLEEFYGETDTVNWSRFQDIGIIEGLPQVPEAALRDFTAQIAALKKSGAWSKPDLVHVVEKTLPGFRHEEKGKYLDEKM
jgi:FlaA1/EpsC-like NDP-sugar epimerase